MTNGVDAIVGLLVEADWTRLCLSAELTTVHDESRPVGPAKLGRGQGVACPPGPGRSGRLAGRRNSGTQD